MEVVKVTHNMNKKGEFRQYFVEDLKKKRCIKKKGIENNMLENQMSSKSKSKVAQQDIQNQKQLEEKLLRLFNEKMKNYWKNVRKEKITDKDSSISCIVGIEEINSEKYGMFNKNKQQIGFIRFWKDFKNEIPKCFKNKDNIVSPLGTQAYEYVFEKDNPFHSMPKRIYRKFNFNKELNRFEPSNEITTI